MITFCNSLYHQVSACFSSQHPNKKNDITTQTELLPLTHAFTSAVKKEHAVTNSQFCIHAKYYFKSILLGFLSSGSVFLMLHFACVRYKFQVSHLLYYKILIGYIVGSIAIDGYLAYIYNQYFQKFLDHEKKALTTWQNPETLSVLLDPSYTQASSIATDMLYHIHLLNELKAISKKHRFIFKSHELSKMQSILQEKLTSLLPALTSDASNLLRSFINSKSSSTVHQRTHIKHLFNELLPSLYIDIDTEVNHDHQHQILIIKSLIHQYRAQYTTVSLTTSPGFTLISDHNTAS